MNKLQNIDNLTAEILILKQQTAQNIIEIGKRLISVKESLPHGEWSKWLKEKVDFSERTAQNFIRVANECSNTKALADLGITKVYALLSMPEEERKEFIKEHDVESMSTRELQKAIKEKQELEAKLKKSEVENNKIKEKLSSIEEKNKEALRNKEVEIENLKILMADINKKLSEAQASGNSEEVEKFQEQLQQSENSLIDANIKIKELEEQLKDKPVDITETIVEKVPEEIERELQELREKVKQPKEDENLIKFKIHFDKTVSSTKDMLEVLAEIKEVSEVEYEKYSKAAAGLLNKMLEKLNTF